MTRRRPAAAALEADASPGSKVRPFTGARLFHGDASLVPALLSVPAALST